MTLAELALAVTLGLAGAWLAGRLAQWAVRRALGPDADPQAHLTRVVVLRAPRSGWWF